MISKRFLKRVLRVWIIVVVIIYLWVREMAYVLFADGKGTICKQFLNKVRKLLSKELT